MTKTFIPGAVDIANASYRYLTRYQSKLTVSATTDQVVALTELIACLATFLTKWLKPPIQP
jgi:hypothetical protein